MEEQQGNVAAATTKYDISGDVGEAAQTMSKKYDIGNGNIVSFLSLGVRAKQ